MRPSSLSIDDDITNTTSTVEEDVANAKRIYDDINQYLKYLSEILEEEVEEEEEVAPCVRNFLSEYRDYANITQLESDGEESDGEASTISFVSNSSSRYTEATYIESPLSTSPDDHYCFTTAYHNDAKIRRSSVTSRTSQSTIKRKNSCQPALWKYSSISTFNSLDMTPKALSFERLSALSKASTSTVDETINALAMFASDVNNGEPSDSFDSIKLLRSQLNATKMIVKKDGRNVSHDNNLLGKLITAWGESITPFLSMFTPKEETPVITATANNNDDNNNKSEDVDVENVTKSETVSDMVVPIEVAKIKGDNKVPPKKDQFKLFELFISIMTNAKAR